MLLPAIYVFMSGEGGRIVSVGSLGRMLVSSYLFSLKVESVKDC